MDNRNTNWTKEQFLWYATAYLNNARTILDYEAEYLEHIADQMGRFDPVLGKLFRNNTNAVVEIRDYLNNKLKDVK